MIRTAYLTIVLILFFSVSCKNNTEDPIKQINYQGNTTLKVEIKNCNASTWLNINSVSLFPFNFSNVNLNATGDTVFEVALKSTQPFLGKLKINKSKFPVYTIPNDTLKINIDLECEDSIVIEYNGVTKAINDYYLNKFRELGYDDIAQPVCNFFSPSYTIYEDALKIDSLFNNEITFLFEYDKKDELPNWFVELENQELFYSNAAYKTSAVLYRNDLCNENTKANESYFDFLNSIPINNTSANASIGYFYFLENYYEIQNSDKNKESASGLKRAFRSIELLVPQTTKDLSHFNRELFLTYQFSQYYDHCVKSEQILKLDSLVRDVSHSFEDTILLGLIKDYSKKKLIEVEKLTSLKKGQTAPYFYLSDEKGKFHKLNDYKGKLVYLSFWATWCSACIKSLPGKNILVGEYSDKPIVFINASIDNKEDRWRRYLKENDNYGINLICKGNWMDIIKTQYNIKGVPRYLLINEKGIIIDADVVSPDNKTELKLLIDNYLSNLKQ